MHAEHLSHALTELENRDEFIGRHIGPDEHAIAGMLASIGTDSLRTLIGETVPATIRLQRPLDLPAALPEHAALAALKSVAAKNVLKKSLIGQGYYGTLTPPVILRNLFENPGWYTAYTPYQAEIAQGRLEALLNYQQMVVDLTGLEIANASLLDEATAAAEAMTMARRISKSKGNVFFVDEAAFPQTIDVIRTRAGFFGFDLVYGKPEDAHRHDLFGALFQYPNARGEIADLTTAIAEVKNKGGVVAVASDLMALVLLKSPGEMGADIALGSSQRFGVPMGFGGPHAAFFATREAHVRSMPGRIIGVSKDARGKTAYRMALQTREQHIRREKANSNICTSQVLLANIAGMYAVWHGPKGLRAIASRIHRLAALLAGALGVTGRDFFDSFEVKVGAGETAKIMQAAVAAGYNLRRVDDETLGISVDETTTREDVAALLKLFGHTGAPVEALDAARPCAIPVTLQRREPILTHPGVQHAPHRARHAALPQAPAEPRPGAGPRHDPARLLHHEAQRRRRDDPGVVARVRPDASLRPARPGAGLRRTDHRAGEPAQGDHRLRCRLHAAEFRRAGRVRRAGIDPPLPGSQRPGRAQHLPDPEVGPRHQPGHGADVRAGSGRGGLRRQRQRRCRRPQGQGRAARREPVLPDDHLPLHPRRVRGIGARHLRHRACPRRPGVHGRRQPQCPGRPLPPGRHRRRRLAHQPAQDLRHPARRRRTGHGADRAQGAPAQGISLHGQPCLKCRQNVAGPHGGQGAVSAAPWGSASILPISWMYITMMGGAGLTRATEIAILNANYVAAKLKDHYPVLYSGSQGRVAHECILDVRAIKAATGVAEIDIAKRLMDYGFHAPTVSFPVAGTLMVEPTESEDKAELDRFCAAMCSIRDEIRRIETGEWTLEQSPLKHAPHTEADMIGDWTRPYSRQQAVFPLPWVAENKFWPFVNRIDDVHGDRNLFCGCVPMENYT
jgi:glycine cleavage system pyridoxal-binding protein P